MEPSLLEYGALGLAAILASSAVKLIQPLTKDPENAKPRLVYAFLGFSIVLMVVAGVLDFMKHGGGNGVTVEELVALIDSSDLDRGAVVRHLQEHHDSLTFLNDAVAGVMARYCNDKGIGATDIEGYEAAIARCDQFSTIVQLRRLAESGRAPFIAADPWVQLAIPAAPTFVPPGVGYVCSGDPSLEGAELELQVGTRTHIVELQERMGRNCGETLIIQLDRGDFLSLFQTTANPRRARIVEVRRRAGEG